MCQDKLIANSHEYEKHLEKNHGVMFGLNEIKKAGKKDEVFPPKEEPKTENEEAEQEMIWIELVEMKYLP